jgi:hypothetical protein
LSFELVLVLLVEDEGHCFGRARGR